MFLLPLFPGSCATVVTGWRCCLCSGTSAAEKALAFCGAQCIARDLSLCRGTGTSEAMEFGLCLSQRRKDGMVKLVGRLRRYV